MGRRNILLLGIAIVAIGLFVIPSTMSMFVGQHSWYSVRSSDVQYALCERCHAAEVAEWDGNTGAHSAYSSQYADTSGCFCHQVNETQLTSFGINTSGAAFTGLAFEVFNGTGTINDTNTSWGDAWRTQATPHAAITIACTDCHQNATAQLNNTKSAHKEFFSQLNASTSANENTACMACHTMVGLNITMERNQGGIEVYANHTINATTGAYEWNVTASTNTTAPRTSNSTYIPPNNGSLV